MRLSGRHGDWPFAVLRLVDRLLPRSVRDRLLLALAPPN
jgi:hypothetical protein